MHHRQGQDNKCNICSYQYIESEKVRGELGWELDHLACASDPW